MQPIHIQSYTAGHARRCHSNPFNPTLTAPPCRSNVSSSPSDNKPDIRPDIAFGAQNKNTSKPPSQFVLSQSRGSLLSGLLRPFIQVIQPQWASSNASRPTAPEPKLDLSQPQDAALYAQRCQAKVHQGEHLTAQENQNLERICSRFPDTADLIQTIRTTVEKSNVLHVNHLLQRMEAESFEPGANPTQRHFSKPRVALPRCQPSTQMTRCGNLA